MTLIWILAHCPCDAHSRRLAAVASSKLPRTTRDVASGLRHKPWRPSEAIVSARVRNGYGLVLSGKITTLCSLLTAAPVSIDPCVVASFHETVFEGSEVEGALSRRCRYTKGTGRKHLLGVDAHHKALAQKA